MRLYRHGLDDYISQTDRGMFGVKFTIITGYQGAADIDVALERGEMQCRLITIAAFSAASRTSVGSRKASPARSCRLAANAIHSCPKRRRSTT